MLWEEHRLSPWCMALNILKVAHIPEREDPATICYMSTRLVIYKCTAIVWEGKEKAHRTVPLDSNWESRQPVQLGHRKHCFLLPDRPVMRGRLSDLGAWELARLCHVSAVRPMSRHQSPSSARWQALPVNSSIMPSQAPLWWRIGLFPPHSLLSEILRTGGRYLCTF